jgi:16S rRNA (guanine527-N7)-methyltransferase
MEPKISGDKIDQARETLRENLGHKGIETTDFQLSLLQKFYDILIPANRRINLVSRNREQSASILDQILDSLLAQVLIEVVRPRIVLDLGSGGGFPGIPLAILNPDIQFHLLEASQKRVSHLERTTKSLSLPNTRVIHERVENISKTASPGRYDLIVARAVADPPTLVGWCAGLLGGKGILATYTGNQEAWQVERLLSALPRPLKPLIIRSMDMGIRSEKPHRLLLMGSFG